MRANEVIGRLKSVANYNEKDIQGMARFGIKVENALVVSMPNITNLAKEIKKEVVDLDERHGLALDLWRSKYREAKLLAAVIDSPQKLTKEQMEEWVSDFDSWDICDNTIIKLFSYSELGWEKAIPWSKSDKEFVKRAGFVLMACLAIHDKRAKDEDFYPFFERIKAEAYDDRNFVKKAVNWALRQIGKSRTKNLYKMALKTAKEILKEIPYKSSAMKTEQKKAARWIANGAINELQKDNIKNRFL